MTPNIDIRLASMIRSMSDVILPAIEPENSLAREQASLMIGHLTMLGVHWRRAGAYATACLLDLRESVGELAADGGQRTLEAASALTAVLSSASLDSEKDYQSAAKALETLIRDCEIDGAPGFRAELREKSLAFSLRQARRDRSWFAMSGFDIDADSLPSIDEIILQSGQAERVAAC